MVAVAGPVRAGDRSAPNFTLRGLDGKPVRLADYRGRAVVVDFWATWCAPCRLSMPHLSAIQNRYRDQGLAVIGVSVDDGDPEMVRRFAARLRLSFRVAVADQHVMDLYGPLRAIPTTFYINRRGDVVRRVVGYIDEETMEAYVRELF